MKNLTDILNESFILSESSNDISDFDRDIINILKKYKDSGKNIKLSDLNHAFQLFEQVDYYYTLSWDKIKIDGTNFKSMSDAMDYFEEEYPESYEGVIINTDLKITNKLTNKSIIINVYYNDHNGSYNHDGAKLELIKGEKMDKFPSKLCDRIYSFWGDNFMFYLNETLSEKNILKVCCK